MFTQSWLNVYSRFEAPRTLSEVIMEILTIPSILREKIHTPGSSRAHSSRCRLNVYTKLIKCLQRSESVVVGWVSLVHDWVTLWAWTGHSMDLLASRNYEFSVLPFCELMFTKTTRTRKPDFSLENCSVRNFIYVQKRDSELRSKSYQDIFFRRKNYHSKTVFA